MERPLAPRRGPASAAWTTWPSRCRPTACRSGEAFQIRDDILGTFGDPAVTGKPVGDDLREGKPTPLLAIATARAGAGGVELLDRVGSPDLGDDEIAAIQALLIETGARDETERLVDELAGEAVAALDKAALTAEARAALTELAAFVAARDR